MKSRFWRCAAAGGPDRLEIAEEEIGPPGRHEVLIDQRAVGINFMDIYYRSGLYPNPSGRLGSEAAGIVMDVGSDVVGLRPGDRVAYAGGPNGAYCTARNIDHSFVVGIPDWLPFKDAAGILLKGMTAGMLASRILQLVPSDRVIVQAAAGGVGQLLGQWLRTMGLRPIGLVGRPEKILAARNAGYEDVLETTSADIQQQISTLTGGVGARAVFDGVGRDTFALSMASLCEKGHLISFGSASGVVEPIEMSSLAAKSISITRPTIRAYTRTRADMLALANEVFSNLELGYLRNSINSFQFDHIPRAHRALEARAISGSAVAEI